MFADDPSMQSRTILPDDDPAFLASASLGAYLQNRVAGLQVNMDVTENAITWRSFPTALYVDEISQTSMNFNGQITEDASYLLSIPMTDIAMVKIISPPFFGGSSTNTGGQGGASLDHVLLPGYSPIKEFCPRIIPSHRYQMLPITGLLYIGTLLLSPTKNVRILISHFIIMTLPKKLK
jgi:hypothetical protein